jgi:hypothetical protein
LKDILFHIIHVLFAISIWTCVAPFLRPPGDIRRQYPQGTPKKYSAPRQTTLSSERPADDNVCRASSTFSIRAPAGRRCPTYVLQTKTSTGRSPAQVFGPSPDDAVQRTSCRRQCPQGVPHLLHSGLRRTTLSNERPADEDVRRALPSSSIRAPVGRHCPTNVLQTTMSAGHTHFRRFPVIYTCQPCTQNKPLTCRAKAHRQRKLELSHVSLTF